MTAWLRAHERPILIVFAAGYLLQQWVWLPLQMWIERGLL